MPAPIYNFNNNLKSWKINAYNINSISGDDLLLTASENIVLSAAENKKIILETSGVDVEISEGLLIDKDLRVSGNLILGSNLLSNSPNFNIPITLDNFKFVDPSYLLTNLTSLSDWVDLSNFRIYS